MKVVEILRAKGVKLGSELDNSSHDK